MFLIMFLISIPVSLLLGNFTLMGLEKLIGHHVKYGGTVVILLSVAWIVALNILFSL